MTDGFALVGGAAPPKRRGRPPGSRNKRPADLVGYMDATTGGTAALQIARRSIPTLRDLKAAGNDLHAADVAMARRRVDAFEAERARLDGQLRDVVRDVLEACFEQAAGLENRDEVKKLVGAAVRRIEAASGGALTLRDALDQMAEDRRALLPYTDQKQAQRVEVKDTRAPPVMVFVGGSVEGQKPEQLQGPVIEGLVQVSPLKSHDDEEG